MKRKRTPLPLAILVLVTLWVTVTCRRQAPPPSPEEIITSAATRLAETTGFHFVVEHSGAPVALDPDGLLNFRRAEGNFAAPDRAQASVRIAAPGLVTDVNVISVAGRQWQTNPLTGRWEELPPDWGFNPAILFDDEIGLPAILTNDLSELELSGPEEIDGGTGTELLAISGRATGERLNQMSGGLIGPDPVEVQLWIAPETFDVVRVIVTEAALDAGEPGIWQVDFSAFDQAVEIEPPATQ